MKINQPIVLPNGMKLKNPIVMAPMTTKMSFYDGVITQDELAYYKLRSGEVGAVITAAANVQDGGKGWEGELSIANDAMIPGLSQLAAAIKRNGTKAILQIFHAGRMTSSAILRGRQPVSASAIPAERDNAEIPRALSDQEVTQLIADFSAAAVRAVQAGFDGIELHGANTYLIQQFFSPHSNQRTDQWGGSLEKRYHFINELVDAVVQAVRDTADRPFIIGYRFSPEEYETPGISFEDTLFLVDHLANKPLDYLHVSLNDFTRTAASAAYQSQPMLAYLHEQIAGRVPLIGVGGVQTGDDAEELLKNAEMAAVGKALLMDPHWTLKVQQRKEATIRSFIAIEDREELLLSNGVWGFLQHMMPSNLK